MLRQYCLVSGDNVLAALQKLQHDRPRRFQTADEMRDHSDLRVVGHFAEIAGQHAARKFVSAFFPCILNDYLLDPQRSPRMPRGPVAVVQEQARNAGADGAHSHECDLGFFHAVSERAAQIKESLAFAWIYGRRHVAQVFDGNVCRLNNLAFVSSGSPVLVSAYVESPIVGRKRPQRQGMAWEVSIASTGTITDSTQESAILALHERRGRFQRATSLVESESHKLRH